MTDLVEEEMEDWAKDAESRLIDLFLHHRKILNIGFFRSNVVDMYNDGICVGMAIAYEALTGESIEDAIDRIYPPPEIIEELMNVPTNEVKH